MKISRRVAATDFDVAVDGIGTFRFGRRTFRDRFSIAAKYSEFTEGVQTPTPWLDFMASAVAAITVLAVAVPPDFDINMVDAYDGESDKDILRIYTALVAKEDDFRKNPGKGSAETGESVV
jgi:hypothetical protein